MKITGSSETLAFAALGLASTAVLATGCGSTSTTSPSSGSAAASAATTSPPVTATATGSAPGSTPSARGTGGAATTVAPAGTPRCHTRDLSGSFAYVNGSGAAGSAMYNIELVNKTTHPCTIYGYPGLLLLDTRHTAAPTNVVRVPQSFEQRITLRPGNPASATARIWHGADLRGNTPTSTFTPPSDGCQPTSVYIEITPPDETTHLVVAVDPPNAICFGGTLRVSAFVAGPVGSPPG